MSAYERPEKEIKMACLEAALRTQTFSIDNSSSYNLDGPDKVLEAAKKYNDWISGIVSLKPTKEL